MEEAGHWSDFFLGEVGAASALAGLVIVAVSINLQRILEFPQLPGRVAEILIMLVGALLASSVALLPGQPLGLPMIADGILLIADDLIGVYWVAASVLAIFAATVWSAWVLLVEILR
jgi:hypothetical protein